MRETTDLWAWLCWLLVVMLILAWHYEARVSRMEIRIIELEATQIFVPNADLLMKLQDRIRIIQLTQ